MNLKTQKTRSLRRKTDQDGWEKSVDALAMHICPPEEWRQYEQQLQQVAWKNTARAQGKHQVPVVRVFPVWKKYRQKALRVATLQQAAPFLRHLPLPVSCFLGELLFK